MKRILSSIVVLLIFFSYSINCYAAEYKETRTGDVVRARQKQPIWAQLKSPI